MPYLYDATCAARVLASNVLAPELEPVSARVLIINTRSTLSNLSATARPLSVDAAAAHVSVHARCEQASDDASTRNDDASTRNDELNDSNNNNKKIDNYNNSNNKKTNDSNDDDHATTRCGSDEQQQHRVFCDMLRTNEDLNKPGVPAFDVVQLPTLKLSADQTADDWEQLARVIAAHYHAYSGFVVQNGTDCMCLTATALSFMLQNLGKPVIFTGSVVPGECVYTDLKRNIIHALRLATSTQLCEVCILFDDKLFRANRATRISRASLQPFDTPHYPPLATMYEGAVLQLQRGLLRPQPHGELRVMAAMRTPVLTLQLGPGLPREVLLRACATTMARAIVLRCHGAGNAPTRQRYMTDALACARRRGVVVVVCTQNLYGTVELHTYAAGDQLAAGGAVGAADMTIEAVLAKLKYLFGLGLDADAVRRHLLDDLRGEVTVKRARL